MHTVKKLFFFLVYCFDVGKHPIGNDSTMVYHEYNWNTDIVDTKKYLKSFVVAQVEFNYCNTLSILFDHTLFQLVQSKLCETVF